MKKRVESGWAAILVWLLVVMVAPVWAGKAEDYVQQAKKYLDAGQLREASIELKNALKADPDLAGARLLQGQLFLRAKDGGGAESAFRRLRAKGVPRAQWWLGLAEAYLLQGNTAKAKQELSVKEPFASGDEALFHELQGLLAVGKGDQKGADSQFSQALALDPKRTRSRLYRVRIALGRQDLTRARAELKQALKYAPESVEAWLIQAEMERQAGHFDAALAAFDKADGLAPGNVPAAVGRAMVYLQRDELEQAGEVIQPVLKQYPKQPLANYIRGAIAFKKGELEKARSSLETTLTAAPDHMPSHILLGAIHYARGEYQMAEGYLHRVVVQQPSSVRVRKLLAATYLKSGDARRAVTTLQEGLGQSRDDAQYLAMLGSAFLAEGERERGIKWLNKAVEMNPDMKALQAQLGLGLLAAGQGEEAEKHLQSATAEDGGLIQADVLLVLVQLRNQELDKARQSADRLVERHPKDPVSWNLRGSVRLAQKDLEGGRADFEKALSLKSDFVPASLNLAALEATSGKLDEARKRLLAVLEVNPDHPKVLLRLAQLAGQEKNADEMLQWLQRAHQADPKAVAPAMAMTRYYVASGKVSQALPIARELVRNHKDNPVAVELLGGVLARNRDLAEAQDVFTDLIRLRPDAVNGYLQRGRVLRAAGKNQQALEDFERALARDPESRPARVARAVAELALGNDQEALAQARALQKRYPDQPQGYELTARVLLKQKKIDPALKALAHGMRASKDVRLVVQRAELLAHQDRRDEAIASLEALPEKARNSRLVLESLGSMRLAAGDYQGAARAYEAAIEKVGDRVANLNNLAWAYIQLGDPRSVDIGRRAFALAGSDPRVADTYAWALVTNQQATKALPILKEAVSKAPDLAALRYHLAAAQAQAGDTKEARQTLRNVLAGGGAFDERAEAEKLAKRLSGSR